MNDLLVIQGEVHLHKAGTKSSSPEPTERVRHCASNVVHRECTTSRSDTLTKVFEPEFNRAFRLSFPFIGKARDRRAS